MGLMTIDLAVCEARQAAADAVHAAKRQAVADAEADVLTAVRHVAACALVAELNGRMCVGVDAIWGVMAGIPYNLQSLLDTPQGWTTIGGYVASELGLPACDYMPGVH